ncbi:MAG: GNAT family N-acetyltransferase [Bacteroidales bacterium]|nr:GNAT family N-acetyltransferase [Bacteroidales bacterium]
MKAANFDIIPFAPYMLDEVHKLITHTITVVYPGFYCNDVVGFFLNYHSKGELKSKAGKGVFLVGFYENAPVVTGYLVGNELGGVYVNPYRQRSGYGAAMVDRLTDIARQKGLGHVWLHSTPPAVNFYYRLGFNLKQELVDYVGPNNAPLPYFLMEKKL